MKDIPTSPRIALIKRNRRVKRLRLLILCSVLLFSLIGASSYFSFNRRININNIIITGNSIIDTKDLDLNIKNQLAGRYLGLFSRSNFLIYPRSKIYNNLLINFPRIEKLSISRKGFNTININITERSGSYLYCGVSIPLNKEDIGENCYFVNNDGYIFDRAPYFSGDIYFKFYTEIKGDMNNPLGSTMIPPARFHELIRFMDGVSSLGFKISYLTISSDGMYSIYLKSEGVNPRIIFKEDNDLNAILGNFSTAMAKKEFANEINSKYDTLSYIDLRFNNKVIYKFQ